MYDIEIGQDVIWIFLFGLYSLIYCLINCNIGFKKISVQLVFFITALIILAAGIGILTIVNSYDFTQFVLLKTAGIAIIGIVCELIMKKWQE